MALREIIARFGFQVDQSGIKKAKSGIAGVVSSLQTLGVVIGAGAVARGIKNFVTSMVDAGDKLGKTATQIGLSGKELQGWQAAAGFAGVETEKFNQSLRILAKNGNAVAQGNKGIAEKFDQLGISVVDSNGNLRSSNDLMRRTGLALGAMKNRTEAVALAQELMGRTGAALLPLFTAGEAGLDSSLAKLEEFGGGLSQEVIPLAEAAQDRFAEFGIATLSLKSKVAVALLPALNQMTLGLAKAVAWFSKIGGATAALRSMMVALGLVVGKLAIAKFGASLLSLARAAVVPLLKFALLVLVVDDLIALFDGRGSVIGETIDKIFGKGTAKAVVDGVKSIGKAFKGLLASGDLEKFDQALEDIFGPPGGRLVEWIVTTIQDANAAIEQGLADMDAKIGGFNITATLIETAFPIEAFRSMGAKFRVLAEMTGADMVEGIVAGIKSNAGAIANAMTFGVSGGLAAARKAIDARSPSRKAAKMIGEPMAQGVAVGAMRAARAAARASSRALVAASGLRAASTLSAPRAGIAAGAGAGATFNSSISITVQGGSANDASIEALRQGVRSELRDNRRATLEALTQRAAV